MIMKVCRLCLSKDVRLYSITSNGLLLLYHQLTGIAKTEDMDEMLPPWVCAECGLQLKAYDKLRQKSLRAHLLLCNMLNKVTYITKDNIDQIDRVKNNLQSNLSCSIINNSYTKEYVYIQEKNESNHRAAQIIKEFAINLEVEESAIAVKQVENIELLADAENSWEFNTGSLKTVISGSEKSFTSYKDSYASASDIEDDSNTKLSLQVKNKKYLTRKIRRKSDINNAELNRVKLKNKNGNHISGTDLADGFITVRKVLSLDEKMAEMDKRRYSRNYTRAPFKCMDCFKGFISEDTFNRHRLRHSEKCGNHECPICKMRFPNKSSSQRHAVVHSYIYTCNQCKFVSSQRSTAQRHGLKHQGKSYQCPHCNKIFVYESAYYGHLRIQHVSQFVCELCGFSFSSAKGVGIHKNLRHALEKDRIVPADGPTCATCDFKFASDEALQTHQRVSHSDGPGSNKRNQYVNPPAPNRKSIVCELCGVLTENGIAYRSHYRRHHPASTPRDVGAVRGILSAPAMCELCGVLFKSKHNLLIHSKVHSQPLPHQCAECGVRFSSKGHLRHHVLNLHRPGEDKAIYPCTVCGKKLRSRSNLARHTFLHTGLRPFPCQICGKMFKSKDEVRTHTTFVHLKKRRVRKPRGVT